jgi:E3 ubiquitin-protein ligase MARCH6
MTLLSSENITSDILQGCAVVSLTLIAFIGLVWLREQILHGGGPEWLDNDLEQPDFHHHVAANAPANAAGGVGGANNGDGEFELRPAGVADAGDGRDDIDEGLDEDDDDNPDHLPMEPAAPEIDPILDPELDVEDDVDGGGDGGGAGGGAGGNVADMNDDGQWNPMEWDRAAEELTWERLLGLDGSLVFLEHVFWVVSLNTLFVLVFAFCPYHIGHFTIAGLKLKTHVAGAHFEGMLTTLCGYCVIGITLVLIHAMTAVLRFRRAARLLGLCYVVVKVTLLLIIEIVAFPVICGWWLDICSLALFDATIKVFFRAI